MTSGLGASRETGQTEVIVRTVGTAEPRRVSDFRAAVVAVVFLPIVERLVAVVRPLLRPELALLESHGHLRLSDSVLLPGVVGRQSAQIECRSQSRWPWAPQRTRFSRPVNPTRPVNVAWRRSPGGQPLRLKFWLRNKSSATGFRFWMWCVTPLEPALHKEFTS